MRTIRERAAFGLGARLARTFDSAFGPSDGMAERLGALAEEALRQIGTSDALYHDYEHTWLVAMAGRDILRGLAASRVLSAGECFHFLAACLLHDIGYVRGTLSGDSASEFVVDALGGRTALPRGASDAALAPYHVDRSKLFVLERFGGTSGVDAGWIVDAIEHTRFPPPPGSAGAGDLLKRLVRAADLIGQFGDPMHPRKANALYAEFEETGMNARLGYASPADLVEGFPAFFRNVVEPHLGEALGFLEITRSGRCWIANLRRHVHGAETPRPGSGRRRGNGGPPHEGARRVPSAPPWPQKVKWR
jgi:hypothetical protein